MKLPRSLRIGAIVVGLAALQGLLVVIYMKVEDDRHSAPAQVGFRYERIPNRPAPALELAGVDGTSRKLSELRGRTVLLHFWATWCPPCREELPGLLALGRELSAAGKVQVVAVSLDTDWTPIREFFGGAVPAEIVLEKSGSSLDGYDLSTLPDTYLLSADGVLQARFGGARNWQSQSARAAVLQAARDDRIEP